MLECLLTRAAFWTSRSTFNYRSLPILDAAFSPDATIVALAHGRVVSLWDVATNALLRVLDGIFSRIGFVGEGRYLVGADQNIGLGVWDLLSCKGEDLVLRDSFASNGAGLWIVRLLIPSALWTSPGQHVKHLLTPPASPYFVITHPLPPSHSQPQLISILVFSPTSSTPIRRTCVATPLTTLLPLAATQLSQLHFIALTPSGLVRFGDSITPSIESAKKVRTQAKLPSVWQEMFGKDAYLDDTADTSAAPTSSKNPPNTRAITVFDGPSHMLPPPSMLFDAFVEDLLATRKSQPEMREVEPAFVYQTEEVAPRVEASTKVIKGREVDDAEVGELEGFFKDLLKPKLGSEGRGDERPNGHGATGEDVDMADGANVSAASTAARKPRHSKAKESA